VTSERDGEKVGENQDGVNPGEGGREGCMVGIKRREDLIQEEGVPVGRERSIW